MDPRPINFMMTPENAIPVTPYSPEYETASKQEKDPYLLTLLDELEELKDLEDVRPVLQQKFNVRQILKNSKLI
jgi:hypothetical protein